MFEFSEGLQAVPSGKFADRCLAWLREMQSPSDINGWMEYNRVALKQFWGTNPGDALELKKAIENRIGNWASVLGSPNFRIGDEVAYENDFIDRSRHTSVLP